MYIHDVSIHFIGCDNFKPSQSFNFLTNFHLKIRTVLEVNLQVVLMSGTRQFLREKTNNIVGCRRGYLVMLVVKIHCYNIAFSLKSIEHFHKKTVKNEKERKTWKVSLRRNNKSLYSVDDKLAGLCRM